VTIICLIAVGADPNAENMDGVTPLHRRLSSENGGQIHWVRGAHIEGSQFTQCLERVLGFTRQHIEFGIQRGPIALPPSHIARAVAALSSEIVSL
jgi:hypothetical protein